MMQFTPPNKAVFDRFVARYPVKRSALLPALHLVQDVRGDEHRAALRAEPADQLDDVTALHGVEAVEREVAFAPFEIFLGEVEAGRVRAC